MAAEDSQEIQDEQMVAIRAEKQKQLLDWLCGDGYIFNSPYKSFFNLKSYTNCIIYLKVSHLMFACALNHYRGHQTNSYPPLFARSPQLQIEAVKLYCQHCMTKSCQLTALQDELVYYLHCSFQQQRHPWLPPHQRKGQSC